MQITNKIKLLLCLLVLNLVYSGCINEDLDDCIPAKQELTIQFLHNINSSYENTLPEVLEYIDLYIYKESGDLSKYERLPKAQLDTTDYAYKTILDVGTYTLIALMNADDEYACEETTRLADARIRIICDGNQQISAKTKAVYYGYDDKLYDNKYEEKQAVATLDWFPVHKTINFANNTNHIEIDAKFNRHLLAGSDIEVVISGKNGITDFVNKCPEAHPVYSYLQHDNTVVSELTYQSYISHITTQRLWKDDGLEITLVKKEPGRADEVLASQPLTPLLMKNPLYNNNYQLERYDIYRLVFEFEFKENTWMLSEILVNDWKTVQQPEEL